MGVDVNIKFMPSSLKSTPVTPVIDGDGTSYKIPQYSLITNEMLLLDSEGIDDWITHRRKKSGWEAGRDFSKIIVDVPQKVTSEGAASVDTRS